MHKGLVNNGGPPCLNIARQEKANDEDTFSVPREHLPVADGGVRDEGTRQKAALRF